MKYKNKGFTLTEFLAVFVILGIIFAIAIPSVGKLQEKFKKEYYSKLNDVVLAAGKTYFKDNASSRPATILGYKEINISSDDGLNLIQKKYLDSANVYKSKNSCSGRVVIANIGDDYLYKNCMKCNNEYITYNEEIEANEIDNLCHFSDSDEIVSEYGENKTIYMHVGNYSPEVLKKKLAISKLFVRKSSNEDGSYDELYKVESETEKIYPINITGIDLKTPIKIDDDSRNYTVTYDDNNTRTVNVYQLPAPVVSINGSGTYIDNDSTLKIDNIDKKMELKINGSDMEYFGDENDSTNHYVIAEYFEYQYNIDGNWKSLCHDDAGAKSKDTNHRCSIPVTDLDNMNNNVVKFRIVTTEKENSSVKYYGKEVTYKIIYLDRNYTVTYDANGGIDAPDVQYKSHGIELELSSNEPIWDDKIFIEWNTSRDGKGKSYKAGSNYSDDKDVTLYAQWAEEPEVRIIYAVKNLNDNGNFNLKLSDSELDEPSDEFNLRMGSVVNPRVYINANDATNISINAEYIRNSTGEVYSTNSCSRKSSNFASNLGIEFSDYEQVYTCDNFDLVYNVGTTLSVDVEYELAGVKRTITKHIFVIVFQPDIFMTDWNYNRLWTNTTFPVGSTIYVSYGVRTWGRMINVVREPYLKIYTGDSNNVFSQTPCYRENPIAENFASKFPNYYRFYCYGHSGWSSNQRYKVSVEVEYKISKYANDKNFEWVYKDFPAATYTITYNANGGSGAPSAQTKNQGTNITLSTVVPTKAGYKFTGWGTTSNGGVKYASGATYSTDANITLYAQWQLVPTTTLQPTCNITTTCSSNGSGDYCKGDITLTLVTTNANSGYNITTSSTPTWDYHTSAKQTTDTSGTTYYGYVKNGDKTGRCNIQVKKDSTVPSVSCSYISKDSLEEKLKKIKNTCKGVYTTTLSNGYTWFECNINDSTSGMKTDKSEYKLQYRYKANSNWPKACGTRNQYLNSPDSMYHVIPNINDNSCARNNRYFYAGVSWGCSHDSSVSGIDIIITAKDLAGNIIKKEVELGKPKMS